MSILGDTILKYYDSKGLSALSKALPEKSDNIYDYFKSGIINRIESKLKAFFLGMKRTHHQNVKVIAIIDSIVNQA
jgi:hypothetical protein